MRANRTPAPCPRPRPSPVSSLSPQPHALASPYLASPRPHRCYLCSRIIQGRLNDVGMLCGSHAARTADGVIEPEAAALLTQVLPLAIPSYP